MLRDHYIHAGFFPAAEEFGDVMPSYAVMYYDIESAMGQLNLTESLLLIF